MPAMLSFEKAGTYWRAEVRQGDRLIAKLKGRYNRQEDIDKFLAENWPYERKYQFIPQAFGPLTITIWKYNGIESRVWAKWVAMPGQDDKIAELRREAGL